MKTKLMALSLLSFCFSFNSFACWETSGSPEVSWVAFKTPAKVGVAGRFTTIKGEGRKKGKDLKELLSGQMVTISSSKIDTKNPARDKNIREAFFSNLSGDNIQARISKVTKKFIKLEVVMNNKKKTIPLTYKIENNSLKATGHLDILDFQASKALQAINKRCFALHEGKTWSHVEVKLSQKLKKCQ